MPLYISVAGDFYGVWSNDDGSVKGDSVPAAKKTTEINNRISTLQNQHMGQARKK